MTTSEYRLLYVFLYFFCSCFQVVSLLLKTAIRFHLRRLPPGPTTGADPRPPPFPLLVLVFVPFVEMQGRISTDNCSYYGRKGLGLWVSLVMGMLLMEGIGSLLEQWWIYWWCISDE